MKDTDTPETDHALSYFDAGIYELEDLASLARRMERERDEARRIAERHAPDECPWLNED